MDTMNVPEQEVGKKPVRQRCKTRSNGVKSSSTIKDVARMAGVSLMTVSRAINTPDQVSPKTLELVKSAIRQCGYIPNRLAGGLSSQRTRQVAVLVPSLSNLVFADLLSGLGSVLEPSGMQMMVFNYHYRQAHMEEQIPHALSWAPEGLVVVGQIPSNISEMLRLRHLPVVEAIELLEDPVDCNVGIAHDQAGAAMARYLIGLGYKKAALISATVSLAQRTKCRVDGFCSCFSEAGLEYPQHIHLQGRSSISEGKRAMHSILSQHERPEVIFCANDDLAFGAMIACQEAGFNVPDDIGIAGFNGLDIALECRPCISTVKVDRRSIGVTAGNLIMERISGGNVGKKIDAGFTIFKGQSTKHVS